MVSEEVRDDDFVNNDLRIHGDDQVQDVTSMVSLGCDIRLEFVHKHQHTFICYIFIYNTIVHNQCTWSIICMD